MNTFAAKERRTTPAIRRTRPYVHVPFGPKQRVQRAEIRRILRSTGAQATLIVGEPNDKYEREADRVADRVMTMPDPKLQRQPEDEEELQAKSKGSETPAVSSNLESSITGMKGGGQPLDPVTRNFFEPRFGHNFSQVRVHSDSVAAETARSINARAFTLGNHVAMGSGEYQPQSQSGQRLLSHELTHVVQQNYGINIRQHKKCRPPIYGHMPGGVIQKLDATNGNTEIIARIAGLIGSPVAVADANEVMQTLNTISQNRLRIIITHLDRNGHYTDFINHLVSPVAAGHTGVIARITSLHIEYGIPTAGTAATTAAQDTQITAILNQGMNINPATGTIANFRDNVAGRTFNQDVRETLDREITALTPRARIRNIRPRFGWPRYEEIAREAKRNTDALYGHYATGSALTAAGPTPNLFDVRDQGYSQVDLIHFANYLVTGHNAINPIYPGTTILSRHNASMGRVPPIEQSILRGALVAWLSHGSNRSRILLVRRNWSGVQRGGNIFIQRWNMGSQLVNRRQFWKMFRTMIHEYLHKVTHTHYSDKARALGRRKQQIFTEGGTSYFDRNVWRTLWPQEVTSNALLRERVEGARYPSIDASIVGTWHGYGQLSQFVQIVNQVGENNARAAYFQGRTDRIGLGA